MNMDKISISKNRSRQGSFIDPSPTAPIFLFGGTIMTKKGIFNCRVSSAEQRRNNSLGRQHNAIEKYAKENNITLVKGWEQAVSSKNGTNVNRKDLIEMLQFCKKEKGINYAIFDEPDRLARSQDEAMWFVVECKRLGVSVKFASQPDLNMSDTFGKLMASMNFFRAEQENDAKAAKTRRGMTEALKNGRYPFNPPIGYRKTVEPALYEIDPEVGPALQDILKKIAGGEITPEEALKEFNSIPGRQGMKPYCMDKGRKMFCNSYYAGIVEKHTQSIDIRNENGSHTPLITKMEHQRIIEIFSGKKKRHKGGGRIGANKLFPLSNMIHCDCCPHSKSKYDKFVGIKQGNRAKDDPDVDFYEKYRCRGCYRCLDAIEVHESVKKFISEFTLDNKTKQKYINKCAEIWKKCEENILNDKKKLTLQVSRLDKELNELTIAEVKNPNDRLRKIIDKKESELASLQDKINNLNKVKAAEKTDFLNFALDFIDNLADKFFEISPEKRFLCKQLLFPSEFYITQDNFVYTPEISPIFRDAINKNEVIRPQIMPDGTPRTISLHKKQCFKEIDASIIDMELERWYNLLYLEYTTL